MLNIFTLENGRLATIQPDEVATRKPIWVDAIAPGEDEREWVAKAFSVILPQPEHLRDIEASARFYEEDGELHVRSDFLLGKESDSRSIIVAFVLSDNMLFSVHDEDLPVFQYFRLRSHGQPDLVADSLDVLVDLYGSDVEFSDEFSAYAGTSVGKRLSIRVVADGGIRCIAVLAVPPQGLAEIGRPAAMGSRNNPIQKTLA